MIRFRPFLGPTLFLLPAMALMAGLGVWQLQRLEWKERLIADAAAYMHDAPITLGETLRLPANAREWRHVRVTGVFDHAQETYHYAPGPMGNGVHVMTPLRAKDGTLLIDRGFVPEAKKNPVAREEGQVKGEVQVTGILRATQPAGRFTPKADEKTRLWFTHDVAAIAALTGMRTEPYFLEADATPNQGGLPVGGQTRTEFPNNHLDYAMTWFALALVLLSIYIIYHIRVGRLKFG